MILSHSKNTHGKHSFVGTSGDFQLLQLSHDVLHLRPARRVLAHAPRTDGGQLLRYRGRELQRLVLDCHMEDDLQKPTQTVRP